MPRDKEEEHGWLTPTQSLCSETLVEINQECRQLTTSTLGEEKCVETEAQYSEATAPHRTLSFGLVVHTTSSSTHQLNKTDSRPGDLLGATSTTDGGGRPRPSLQRSDGHFTQGSKLECLGAAKRTACCGDYHSRALTFGGHIDL